MSMVLFKSDVFLLILCLNDASIVESGIVRFPTIIVLLLISPFVQFLFYIFRCSSVSCINIYNCIFCNELTSLLVYNDLLCCFKLFLKSFVWYNKYSYLFFGGIIFWCTVFFHLLRSQSIHAFKAKVSFI